MTTALLPPVAGPSPAPPGPARGGLAGSIWLGPLVPVALAATAGIVLDRYRPVPPYFGLLALAACLVVWGAAAAASQHGLALVYLWGAVIAAGALYHHARRSTPAPDDIARYATAEPRPAALRGTLDSEPVYFPGPP